MAVQPCMKDSFTNTITLWLWAHVDTRIVHLLILVAVSARGPGILHDKMHVISGRGEKTRHLVSKSKSILREHLRRSNPDATQIPFLIYFLQEYKLLMRSLEASRETLPMNTEKDSS